MNARRPEMLQRRRPKEEDRGMSIETLGHVHGSGGRYRKVQWDSRSGEIYIQDKSTFISEGSMRRIGMTTQRREPAMGIAQEWLNADWRR